MTKCPKCKWRYDPEAYALDTDSQGRELVPYHLPDGKPGDPLEHGVACVGSLKVAALKLE